MTPKQAAKLAGVPHDIILAALHSGALSGRKYHKRWQIKPAKAWRFGRVNKSKLSELKDEYICLYWQGRTVEWLQAHTKADFEARNIVCPASGFAEKIIYESLKRRENVANQ